MTIQVSMTALTPSAPGPEFMFDIKEFLVGLGWTVEGSGDTSTGGMDAVDRITTSGDFTEDAWICLQSPHASASDRVQIIFRQDNINGNNCQYFYNPTADYTGGGASTLPTSPAGTSRQVVVGNLVDSFGNRQAIIGDDAPPYGWAARKYVAGSPDDNRGAWAFIPLEQSPTNPGKPYVAWGSPALGGFEEGSLNNADVNAGGPTGLAEGRLPPQLPSGVGAALYEVDSVTAAPNGMETSESGEDFGVPMAFFTKPPLCQYVGFSTFMQWTGNGRASMSTFNNRTRIVFDDVTFPWDGSTVPLP